MKRLAVVRQSPNEPLKVLAVFTLEAGELQADWRDPNLQAELEEQGLPVDPETGRSWTLEEPEGFFEALPRVYARTTLINVYDPDRRASQ